MARTCKLIGSALSVLGVAIGLLFVVIMARDDAYRQAALAASRNSGNVMYDAEFKGAQVQRAFEIGVVIAGILLTINGFTLLGLGVVAGRVDHT
ncbi:MAG: hypothetical protein ACHQ4J_11960, partial [Candidatus Binatia bacterium]